VFGQRGSGKSSLLRHLQQQKQSEGKAAVWIDQEVFTGLAYPDVLVSCVLEISEGLGRDLVAAIANQGKTDRGWRWRRSRCPGDELHSQLVRMSENLRVLKFAPLDAEIQWSHRQSAGNQVDALGRVSVGSGLGGSISASKSQTREVTRTETITTNKAEYLERALVDFRQLISSAADTLSGGFIFVDDLYLISRSDQPRVLGYLHRLLKDSGLYLKIGSIRYATNNYSPGDPPVGMQEGHDALEVALDKQFNYYGSTKAFLERILEQLATKAEVDHSRLYTDGALDRLMLASGGVARDYLRLARSAIEEARSRGPSTKTGSTRIIVEDVNAAAGKIAPSKFEDLRNDAPEEADALQVRVIDLTNFCRERKSAYFLVDIQDSALMDELRALQHLRFAHLLFQSETIPDRRSQRFNVYLLDIAQLSFQRATQGVDFDGWQHREQRRNRRLVYSRNWSNDQRGKADPNAAKASEKAVGPKEGERGDARTKPLVENPRLF